MKKRLAIFGGGAKKDPPSKKTMAPTAKLSVPSIFRAKKDPAPVKSSMEKVTAKNPFECNQQERKKEDSKFKKPDDDSNAASTDAMFNPFEALLFDPPKPMRKKTTSVQPPAKKLTSKNTDMFADDAASTDAMFKGILRSGPPKPDDNLKKTDSALALPQIW